MTSKAVMPPILTFEDYTEAEILKIRAEAEEAATEAQQLMDEILAVVSSVDPVELLARLSFRMIVGLHGFGTKGHNPSIHAHELELVQALALSCPRSRNNSHTDMAGAMDRILPLVRAHTIALQKMTRMRLSVDPDANKVEAVLDRIRATTHTVRGPRHAYQTRAYLRDLAASLDGRFMSALGWTITELVDCLEGFAFRLGDDLAKLRDALRPAFMSSDAVRAIERFRADNPDQRDHPYLARIGAGTPLEQVKGALFAIFEEQLPPVFRLDGPDAHPAFERLRPQLSSLALGFGDISGEELQHLKLGNPVRSRPFVADSDGSLYLFCSQTMYAYLVELIDAIVDQLDETKPDLKSACADFKADWLETRLETLVRGAFPDGQVIANAKWRDATGKPGETDCILAIDQTVGLFEAKSGRITPSARRGGPGRLKSEIKDLLVHPSLQSARFADLLRSTKGPIKVDVGRETAHIAGSVIREIVRVNILFDTLGPLTSGTRQLVEAGFIAPGTPMAPSMSIFELETLFELLPDQISRLHYLRRRAELEEMTTFEADEMDLIAFYLETGFCIAQLEQEKGGFGVYGWSDRIARLYDLDGLVAKPDISLKRTPFLHGVIVALETARRPGWTRFGYRLCKIGYRDQFELQRRKEGLMKRVRRLKDGQAVHVGFAREGTSDQNAIALCIGKSLTPYGIEAHSRTAAGSVMRNFGAANALLLYWDAADRAPACRYAATFVQEDEVPRLRLAGESERRSHSARSG